MQRLQQLDIDLFRLINGDLVNPLLDTLMPLASGAAGAMRWFYLVAAGAALLLIWKDRRRGTIFLLMLALVVAIGDGFICNTLKDAIDRDRPFIALDDVRCLLGKGASGSMPSSHAANWFSAVMVAFIYYRRGALLLLPPALVVGFSRVYCGVHFPSDVVMGAVVGAGYAVAIVCMIDVLWSAVGRRWFPVWHASLPSLISPPVKPAQGEEFEEAVLTMPKKRGIAPAGFQAPHVDPDAQWLRLGYVVIALLLLARLFYIGSKTIQLSEDEAYQWVWSKHLALSYFSKPLLIAVTQFLGTSLFGDTAFGVRFFSPIISAGMSLLLLRFFGREVNARAGFFLVLIMAVTPLMAAGAVLMTVDPLSVMFWTLGMLAGWRAVQDKSTTADWLWVGLWMGLGFLSKYTALFQWLCWVVFFALWKPARKQLLRPGPYLAFLVNAICTLPVVIWNAQHDWVTVHHVADDAGAGRPWNPTLRYFVEFIGSELGLLNPVFFVAMVWAAVAFWRHARHNPKLVYFFSMGAPLFLVYLAHSFRSRVLPNWIAPSVVPLFCLMVIYWDMRLRLGNRFVKRWLATGLLIGLPIVLVGYETNLVRKVAGKYLPIEVDPLRRLREWDTTAKAVEAARQQLLADGKPVFIITDHYGMTGQLSFHLPQAREAIRDMPLVYFRTDPVPQNQFYFWPGYTTQRVGQNAIFVRELNRKRPLPKPPPPVLESQFESVVELGVTNIMYHGSVLRPLQIFACRGLRE